MFPGFLKREKEALLFDGDGELIFYIPETYFANKNAEVIGSVVEAIGVFTYNVFDKNGKALGMKNFNYPTVIQCRPTSIEKVSDFKIKDNSESTAYRLLHFEKGAEVICSTRNPMSVTNVEKFVKLLLRSKLPETIPYNELHEYIAYNCEINGFNYNMTTQLYGVLISELCRDPKDLTKPFRLTDMKDMTGYKSISVLTIPKYISPFTAITSENADESIANAIINKTVQNSPLEKNMMN